MRAAGFLLCSDYRDPKTGRRVSKFVHPLGDAAGLAALKDRPRAASESDRAAEQIKIETYQLSKRGRRI